MENTSSISQQEPVSILDQITGYLNRWMVFSNEDHPLILALWVLHTYTFQESFPRAPWVTPYLYVNSSGPACGKTLLLDLLKPITYAARLTGDMSSAAMFRRIEESRPTLLIDEVDTIWNGAKHDDLRRTLNTGYKHGGSTDRVSGNTVETFSTFCPKVLAGIRDHVSEIPQTILSRSIPITLTRKSSDEKRETWYSFIAEPIGEELAAIAKAWIIVNAEKIISHMPEPGYGLESRQFEISMPLLQIAHALGVEQEARDALAVLLAPEPEKELPIVTALRTIKQAYDEGEADKLYSRDLAALFGWSTKKLSATLKPLGIDGSNTMQVDGAPAAKGYWRSQFVESWERFGI